jgi:citronellyl-CoA dehydrogenase
VASIGVSEPGAGSDVAGLKTTARKDGGDYIINGTKMWITNGMQSDWICLLVNTSDDLPHKNKSMIVVPMNSKGVVRAQKIDKLGMWASDTAQLFFDEVRVPQRYLIGQEGAGFAMQMQQFQEERMFATAMGIKGLEMVVQATIDYTRDRKAFGAALLDNQVIHFRLAELQTEIEALRALLYRTVRLYDLNQNDREVVKLASMCKLKAGRLSREVTDACLQYWGGMGYAWESIVSRLYRDFRLASIGGGADEVMLGIICKLMNTLPSTKRG